MTEETPKKKKKKKKAKEEASEEAETVTEEASVEPETDSTEVWCEFFLHYYKTQCLGQKEEEKEEGKGRAEWGGRARNGGDFARGK